VQVDGSVLGSTINCSVLALLATTTKSFPLPPGLDAIERELERIVKDSLSSFALLAPRKLPQMYDADHCEVVQVDGSVLGSMINCLVLALLDTGVAMRGVLVATTCVMYYDDDRPGRTVVGDEDKTTNYEEDDDNGVVGSGRRRITVLVTESSFSDNVRANSDDGSVVVAMHTFGSPVSLDGLLSTVKCACACSALAMAAFFRIVIERKVQRMVQMIWS
jgi:ribonuclease PH